jgi:hypothetical protein
MNILILNLYILLIIFLCELGTGMATVSRLFDVAALRGTQQRFLHPISETTMSPLIDASLLGYYEEATSLKGI